MMIRIAVPCRRFSVRAHLGYAEGLSRFEQYALRVLAAKPCSALELASLLGLDERMSLDLSVDLVKAGLAELHLDTGRLQPTALVAEALGDPAEPHTNWAARFASERAPESEEVELLQELVSGAVFPAPRHARCPERNLIAPEKHGLPALETIERTVLGAAAARALESARLRHAERARNAGDVLEEDPPGLQVVEVSLTATQRVQGASDANGWRERILVHVDVRLDEDGEIREIFVVEPRTIPRSVRHAIARGLLELRVAGLRAGEGQFFDLLRERASHATRPAAGAEVAEAWDPSSRIAALATAVGGLGALAAAGLEDLGRRHDELSELWEAAREEVVEAAGRAAAVELIEGTAAHHECLLDALASARDQVVLVGPWIGQVGSNRKVRDAMTDAVARGVRLHLVWGMDPEERQKDWSPDITALCAALDPKGNGAGGLFASEWAAGVHAKLMVKDFEWMLVSSCNFLNAPRERSAIELGVRVRLPVPATDGSIGAARWPARGGPLPATLGWARQVVPDFAVRRTMIVDPILGGVAGLPQPIELQGDLRAPKSEMFRSLWIGWWQKRVDGLRTYFDQIGTHVLPVFDLAHRRLLFDALELATRRVVVSSDKLGVGLLGQVPFEATLAARARGVDVTVVFAEIVPGEDLTRRRTELAGAGVTFITADIHAKVLVADDRVCISSFNFLSFEGIGRGGRVRREFGVQVFEQGFAEKVIAALLG